MFILMVSDLVTQFHSPVDTAILQMVDSTFLGAALRAGAHTQIDTVDRQRQIDREQGRETDLREMRDVPRWAFKS